MLATEIVQPQSKSYKTGVLQMIQTLNIDRLQNRFTDQQYTHLKPPPLTLVT